MNSLHIKHLLLLFSIILLSACEHSDSETVVPDDVQGTKPNTSTVHRIAKLEYITANFDKHIYTFQYNENGQVENVKIQFGDNERIIYDISYTYGNHEILISTNGYNNYKGIRNEDGYVQTILQQESAGEAWKDYADFTYDSNGQVTARGEAIKMEYSNGNRVYVCSHNRDYTIDYSKEENQTLPDLNDFISAYYSSSLLYIAKFHPFSLPPIFGISSTNLISQENSSESCYKYSYKKDEKGRIIQVVQTHVNKKENKGQSENSSKSESIYNITYK